VIPTALLTSCLETADTLIGEERPAKNLHLQKSQRKLRQLITHAMLQSTFNYMEAVTHLVVMACLLDSGNTAKNHCNIYGYTKFQPVFKDFFAGQQLEDAMKDLENAKRDAGQPDNGLVLAVPAPEMKGSLNETLVIYETSLMEEYEITDKKEIVGALHVGVDLLGKPPPNDHKNPLNYICAVYRHLGDDEVTVAKGTPYQYVVHLDRSEKAELSKAHEKVWDDLIEDHAEDMRALLLDPKQRFDYDFLENGKPNSYTTELYEQWLEQQMDDERFFTEDTMLNRLLEQCHATYKMKVPVKASAQVKKGEDSTRARAVISPGVAGSEGLHQARVSPLVRALEALHAIKYNHTNLKGLTEDTKRIRFAEYLMAVPKGAIVFGTDKSKNDSCFREGVWKKCVRYLAKMADIFEEKMLARPYCYTPDEAKAPDAFPTGTLDMKFWIVKLTPLLAFLLSGIGPTGFINRMESTTEDGVMVLEVFGEEAYEKWRKAERVAFPSEHPSWSNHPPPHVAEIVQWEPLAPRMVTTTSVKCEDLEEDQIVTVHMGIREGDDQSHAFIPPTEWSDLSIKEKAIRITAALSRATNFIFEPALTADELDMVGHNGIVEMLSAWVGLPSTKVGNYDEAVIVPKILKALRKMPHCSVSSQHTIVYDEEGTALHVEKNNIYWSLALTRYYCLAIMNKESLGVRGLFLSLGDYCYNKLSGIMGQINASAFRTVYGDRDPERKRLEEAAATTFDTCGAMHEAAHDALTIVLPQRVMRVCCTAWRSELPQLTLVSKDVVCDALLEFDSITMNLDMKDEMIEDPMILWEYLEIGCLLEPLVTYATVNHRKIAAQMRSRKVLADNEETVQLARAAAGTTPYGTARKEGKSGKAGADQGGKSKGKDKGKGTGGKGKGKGSPDADRPKPSWSKGGAHDKDKWWRNDRAKVARW
jgi:hypothetical protein